MKSADGLCLAGVGLVGWALWSVSPALAGGVLGCLLVAMGIAKHRERKAPPKGDAQ